MKISINQIIARAFLGTFLVVNACSPGVPTAPEASGSVKTVDRPQLQRIIQHYDRDQDGQLNQSEHMLLIIAFVEQRDANHDNCLQKGEIQNHLSEPLKKIDVNKDGKTTLAEAVAAGFVRFVELDTNHDERLSLVELEAAELKK